MAHETARLLTTGATGKVGQAFLRRLLADSQFDRFRVRALCHNRTLPEHARLEVAPGDIADQSVVKRLMEGVTHVLHLATCKESPERIIDVTVKGLLDRTITDTTPQLPPLASLPVTLGEPPQSAGGFLLLEASFPPIVFAISLLEEMASIGISLKQATSLNCAERNQALSVLDAGRRG